MSWNTICFWRRDLQFLQAADFADLEARVLEVQRMLTSFAARVNSAVAS